MRLNSAKIEKVENFQIELIQTGRSEPANSPGEEPLGKVLRWVMLVAFNIEIRRRTRGQGSSSVMLVAFGYSSQR